MDHPTTRTVMGPELAADTIVYNGELVTVYPAFSIANAIAIHGGRIVGIGRGEDLRALAVRLTETVDLPLGP